MRNLAFAAVLWFVWQARNDCCFRHALLIVSQVLCSTLYFYSSRAGAVIFTRGHLRALSVRNFLMVVGVHEDDVSLQ